MKRQTLISTLILTLSLFTAAPITATAVPPEEKGLQIAQQADQRDTGFGDTTVEMQMTLRNSHGETSQRRIRLRTLEVQDDGDKSLSIFDTPNDIKGTAFLSFSHKVDDDDLWLYLPALKRVKRISSSNKSGSFMGSEFAYEDFGNQEVEKHTYKWLRDETLDGHPCYVVEQYPVDLKNSGYTRRIVWLDTDAYRVQKVEYYDRKNALLKTFRATQYQQYLERYWRANEMTMTNHQTGKSTTLIFSDYTFGTGLTDRDFDRNSLARAR